MRLGILVVCVAGLMSFNVSAVTAPESAAAGKEKVKSSKTAEKGVQKIIVGPVASVNSEKKEIAVERNGKTYPILLDASTKISSASQPVTLDMIKPGDGVTITYLRFSDGSRIALNVEASIHAVAKEKTSGLKSHGKKAVSAPAKAEPKAEAKVETKKSPSAASKAEAKTQTKPSVSAEVKTQAKPEVKKEVNQASKSEVKAEPKPEVKAEVKKEPMGAPKAEPKAAAQAAVKKDSSAVKAEPKAEAPTTQPKVQN